MLSFFEPIEEQAIQSFLEHGYFKFPIADQDLLLEIKDRLFAWSLKELGQAERDIDDFFDNVHQDVSPERLNAFRLALIGRLNADVQMRPRLYRLAKQPLHWLVGNELAMQRALNLSVQLPGDDSSLLPLHSDVWSGNSPYEVVFWLPLVDCYATKSMFLLPPAANQAVLDDFHRYADLSTEAFFREIESQLVWLEVPFGHAVVFSHSLIHGNRRNEEAHTRWTLNVRFKSLLSPYGSKELGESFMPISIRPATRIGYAYRKPSC